jgi:hypothetical protein
VESDEFHVWTVETLDEALSLLLARNVGERDAHGRFPEGSINGAIAARLRVFSEHSRRFLDVQSPRELV